MDQAIRPSFLNIPSLADKEAERKGASDEERVLYAMSKTSGWKAFSDLSQKVLSELDEVNTQAIANGHPLEEIGKNTIVISLTKDVINRLLNKVEDAKESCEAEEE